ncbi:MAG: hydroxyphenylacetyl-CoA thioesterase PaaI [Acidimicrobiales bacterium]
MLERDTCAAALGIELVDVGSGRATMRMTVRPDMLNGHGQVHGGLIFTLADTAFAVACNSDDEVTVAAAASIEFLATVGVGAVLVAEAERRHEGRRTGVYDITVTEADGARVALFRGRSHRIGGSVTKAST